MKYRILIRTVNVNIFNFNWYIDENLEEKLPWETEDERVALRKYRKLLNRYSAEDLTLLQVVSVSIHVKKLELEKEIEEAEENIEEED